MLWLRTVLSLAKTVTGQGTHPFPQRELVATSIRWRNMQWWKTVEAAQSNLTHTTPPFGDMMLHGKGVRVRGITTFWNP